MSIEFRDRLCCLSLDRENGNSDHYFHFVCDVALPLFAYSEHFAEELAEDPVVAIHDEPAAAFLGLLQEMFPLRFVFPTSVFSIGRPLELHVFRTAAGRLVSRTREQRDLLSFNSRFFGYRDHGLDLPGFRELAARFRAYLRTRLGIAEERQDTVVLIEREPGVDRGAGRRTIDAHDDLARALAAQCAARSVRFENVRLADMTFAEQLRLFSRCACVVGQHGAGLVNLLFTEKGATLVELDGDAERHHFERLAAQLDRPYTRIVCERTDTGLDTGQDTLSVDHGPVLEAALTALDRRAITC